MISPTTAELLEHGFVPGVQKKVRRPPLDALTGLRFVAAFYVLLYHFGAAFSERAHMPHPVTTFLQNGNLGVCLFFLLSGFILFYNYAENLETGRDHYRFFVARFCRIYPVYLLAAALQFLVMRGLPVGYHWMYLTLMQSWTPASSVHGFALIPQAWSLSVEVFFYICFPLLLPLVGRVKDRRILWLFLIALGVVAAGLQLPVKIPGTVTHNLMERAFLPLLRVPEFVMGMLLSAIFLSRPGKARENLPRVMDSDSVTVLCMLPPIAVLCLSTGTAMVSAAAIFLFLWAIYRLAGTERRVVKLFSTKVFILLGGASYSIYLLQLPVRELAHEYLRPGLDAMAAPVILIVLSVLIFLYYEEPVRERLRGVLTRPSPR